MLIWVKVITGNGIFFMMHVIGRNRWSLCHIFVNTNNLGKLVWCIVHIKCYEEWKIKKLKKAYIYIYIYIYMNTQVKIWINQLGKGMIYKSPKHR